MAEPEDDSYKPEDDPFPYGRPSVSSWIACVAVAVAFFIVGGYIKTYLQLEALRDETQREIRQLRSQIEGVRAAGGAPAGRRIRLPNLPRAERRPRRAPAPEATDVTEAADGAASRRTHIPEIDDAPPGITYEFGRKTRQTEPARAEKPAEAGFDIRPRADIFQVIAAGGQKRVLVEGGRDAGRQEGGRLELSRDGRYICDLRVQEVYDVMAACEVVHALIPPRPGDLVRAPAN